MKPLSQTPVNAMNRLRHGVRADLERFVMVDGRSLFHNSSTVGAGRRIRFIGFRRSDAERTSILLRKSRAVLCEGVKGNHFDEVACELFANRLKKLVSFHCGRSGRLAMRSASVRSTSTNLPPAERSTG